MQTLGDGFVGEAVGTGFSGQIASMRLCRKTVRPRLVKRCAKTLGDSFVGEAVGTGFSGQIASMRLCRKTVRPRLVKRCAKTLGDGTCIASLSGSDTKNPLLLARVFQDKFHQYDCSEKLCAQDLPKFPDPGPWEMHSFVGRERD